MGDYPFFRAQKVCEPMTGFVGFVGGLERKVLGEDSMGVPKEDIQIDGKIDSQLKKVCPSSRVMEQVPFLLHLRLSNRL